MSEQDYKSAWIKECRKLGIGNLSIGHRSFNNELTKEDWTALYHALLAFQYHVKLIVAHRRAMNEVSNTK
jgi:hypothetical protein